MRPCEIGQPPRIGDGGEGRDRLRLQFPRHLRFKIFARGHAGLNHFGAIRITCPHQHGCRRHVGVTFGGDVEGDLRAEGVSHGKRFEGEGGLENGRLRNVECGMRNVDWGLEIGDWKLDVRGGG